MFKERVEEGIKFLDKRDPSWLDKIDLDSLDLTEYDECVIAQVFGGYLSFIRNEFGEMSDIKVNKFMTDMGFNDEEYSQTSLLEHDSEYYRVEKRWNDLQDEWVKQIQERLDG